MNDDFRYIAAIAEHGSISKAARAVHLSQPGLSQRLKRLEAQLGTELFDRATSPLQPTESGKVFVKYALSAIAAESSMRRELDRTVNKRKRNLRIGVSMPRANALLAGPIIELYESHLGCAVELKELSTLEQLHDRFMHDEVDFALLTPIYPDPSLYELEVLCREMLVVAASTKLSIPQLPEDASSATIAQLEGMPFVLPTCGAYFDPLIDNIIESPQLQLDIVVRDCDAALAIGLVEDGLGVALVPSTYIAGRRTIRSLELADIEAGNVLRYVRRRDRPASPEEILFMKIVRKHLADA